MIILDYFSSDWLLSDVGLFFSCMAPKLISITIFSIVLLQFSSVLTSNDSSHTVSRVSSNPQAYCSFFSNRAPSPQPGLTYCTWFKEYSCCRDNEVRLIFSQVCFLFHASHSDRAVFIIQVRPLIGASSECTHFINALMCYVCSPLQHAFYKSERLHVCLSYCDRMYQACATALMKGIPVGELYTDGRAFCLSRRFEINDIFNSSACFSDDGFLIHSKRQMTTADRNISSTNVERPSLLKLFLVICLAGMLSFILCS